MSEPTYTVDDKQYQVHKFTDEGKIVFNYLVEIQQEINIFQKKIEILKAASITLNNKLNETLTDSMVTTLGDVVD
tara:strand:- start:45 stop:269 length:225 start_codon:yes stop_codon:yes gene_type:complete